MPFILIHDPRHLGEVQTELLATPGYECEVCCDHEALLAALSRRCPDLLIHELDDLDHDLEILSTLRHFAPHLPIILLGEPASLDMRRVIQELRPAYYGVLPLDRLELSEAVHGTLGRNERRSTAAGSSSA